MSLTLLDWRRQVRDLYAQVRAETDPVSAHELWRTTRDELFATHPDSPLLPDARAGFTGLTIAPYDPALRFEVTLDADVEPQQLEVPTATDGVVPFKRIGVLHLPGLGDLDAWWLDSYGGGLFVPVKDAGGRPRDLRRRPLRARHREGRRPRRRRAGRHGSSSTSTSPTTRPAPTTRPGHARSRLPATHWPCRSRGASLL